MHRCDRVVCVRSCVSVSEWIWICACFSYLFGSTFLIHSMQNAFILIILLFFFSFCCSSFSFRLRLYSYCMCTLFLLGSILTEMLFVVHKAECLNIEWFTIFLLFFLLLFITHHGATARALRRAISMRIPGVCLKMLFRKSIRAPFLPLLYTLPHHRRTGTLFHRGGWWDWCPVLWLWLCCVCGAPECFGGIEWVQLQSYTPGHRPLYISWTNETTCFIIRGMLKTFGASGIANSHRFIEHKQCGVTIRLRIHTHTRTHLHNHFALVDGFFFSLCFSVGFRSNQSIKT